MYPKYNPATYHTRDLYRRVKETGDLRPVWAHKNAQKWSVDPEEFLAKCGSHCGCCGSELDYGLGKNNQNKQAENTPSTDHKIPRSLNESLTTSIDNLWIICQRCNLIKNDSTADDADRYSRIGQVLREIGYHR